MDDEWLEPGLPDLGGLSLAELRELDTPELREAMARVVAELQDGRDVTGC